MGIHNQLNNRNQNAIQMTSAETTKYFNLSLDNPELHDWMKQKSMSFDQGLIDISINGMPAKLQTNKENFGKISI